MGRKGVDLARYQELLRAHLSDGDLTPTALARQLRMDPSNLCRYAKGLKTAFQPHIAYRIAEELGRDVRELDNHDWADDLYLFGDRPEPPRLGENVILSKPALRAQLPLFRGNGRIGRGRRHRSHPVDGGGTPEPPRVFVSYARGDAVDFSELLREKLLHAGCRVWRDVNDLPAGKRWNQEIIGAIRECDVLLVVLSSAAKRSEHIVTEVGIAIGAGIPVIPLRIKSRTKTLESLIGYQELNFARAEDRPWHRIEEEIHTAMRSTRTDFRMSQSRTVYSRVV